MREIKFRAWDTLRKEMSSWKDLLSCDYLHLVLEGTSNDRWIPLQFTGLKDKNGKEIYEGDIIKNIYGYDKIEVIGFVEYSNFVGAFYLTFNKSIEGTIGVMVSSLEEKEVIGNIYENPELLK